MFLTIRPALYSREGCQTVCGRNGGVWPQPASVSLGRDLATFLPSGLVFANRIPEGSDRLAEFVGKATGLFRENVKVMLGYGCGPVFFKCLIVCQFYFRFEVIGKVVLCDTSNV